MKADDVRAAIEKIQTEHGRCDPKCPGWAIMDSDERGTEIERCDACLSGAEITDDDVRKLPEAKQALRLEFINMALTNLKYARDHLSRAGTVRAVARVRAVMKSVEGAKRHAERSDSEEIRRRNREVR
jgi:hypothetical protein